MGADHDGRASDREPVRSNRTPAGAPGEGPVGARRALLVVFACLLATASWLLFLVAAPAVAPADALAAAVTSPPWRDGPSPDTIALARIRTAAAPSRVQDPPKPAAGRRVDAGTLVQGSLADPSGAPITDTLSAGVSFVDRTGMRRRADAGHEGAYALPGLAFGTYWVTVTATGYRPLDATLDLRPERPCLRLDFTLQEAVALRIRVRTPDGRSLSEVMLQTRAPIAARLLVAVATQQSPGSMLVAPSGERDPSEVGHFQARDQRMAELPPDCIGILQLDGDPPVHVSLVCYQVVLQTQRIDAGQGEVTFVVSPEILVAGLAAIRAHVVDAATGDPVPGARVMLKGGTHSDPGVATDAMGIAELDRREPGRLDLQVWARGYERYRMPVEAIPGTTRDLGTIRLAKEVAVEGRVVDDEGCPLAASFAVGRLDPADRSIQWFAHEGFESSGAGTFSIPGLGRGQYVIRTRADVGRGEWRGPPWVSGIQRLDTRAGPITGLELRLVHAAKLVLRLAGPDAVGLRFAVDDESGLQLVDGALGPAPRPIELPTGSYRVCLQDARGTAVYERSVTLGAEPTLLDLNR